LWHNNIGSRHYKKESTLAVVVAREGVYAKISKSNIRVVGRPVKAGPFEFDELSLFGPDASATPAQQQQQQQFQQDVARELYDDKNHKAAIQSIQQTGNNQESRTRFWCAVVLMGLLCALLLLGFVYQRRRHAAPTQQDTNTCGWGTTLRLGLCAPDERTLFDWDRLQRDRTRCQLPDLDEWTCKRFWADERNQGRRLFDDFLAETAQQWANSTALVQQARELCEQRHGQWPTRRASENLTCQELGLLALHDQLLDRRIRVVRHPVSPRQDVALAWMYPLGANHEAPQMLDRVPCEGTAEQFWAALEAEPMPVWQVGVRDRVFPGWSTLPAPSETLLLHGLVDEDMLPAPHNTDCATRVLLDLHELVEQQLAYELRERWDTRHLRGLFEQLQQRLQRSLRNSATGLGNVSRHRMLQKLEQMELLLLVQLPTEPVRLPSLSYTELVLQHRTEQLQRALRRRVPQPTHHDILLPSIYYDRARNALAVHPFAATTPLYPGDTAHHVLARIGWRMARELYWALDESFAGAYDADGVHHPEGWLYESTPASAETSECRARRFAFCLVLRLLGEQDFVPSALRNTTAEWAQQVFWSAGVIECHDADTSNDDCMRTFAPYRATFDCRQSTKRAQQQHCPSDGTLWCQCLPFD
jgi:hypothetical protein